MEQSTFSSNVYKLSFLLLVISTLFQDLRLQAIFGTIARSPVVFISPVIFVLLLLLQRKYVVFPFSQLYLKYWIITFIVSVFILFATILFVTKGVPEMYGQSPYGKLFKSSSYNLVIFIFSYCLLNTSSKVSLSFIYKVVQGCFWFLVVLAVLEYFDLAFFDFLHTENVYGIFNKDIRIQLTSFEPSAAAPFFITFAVSFILLRYQLGMSKWITIISGIISILILTAIASKGVILIVVALLWAIRKNLSYKTIVPVIILSVPIIRFIITDTIPLLQYNIEDVETVSTRLTTVSASLYSLVVHPFGEGYGTYLYYFPKLIVPVFKWVVNFTGIPFLGGELEDMLYTGNSLISKSGVASEVMYNGWIAVIMLVLVVRYFNKLAGSIKNQGVYILFVFIMSYLFLSFLFSVSVESSYFFILPLAIIIKIIDTQHTSLPAKQNAT